MAITLTTDLGFDTTAYNKLAWYDLRPELYFDALADVKTTPQTHTGASVTFTIMHDLPAATTPLSEGTDVTSAVLDDDPVSVTLQEYGNAVETSAKVRNTSYIPLDPQVASVIGFNAGISIDTITRNVLVSGTNVSYGGTKTSRATLAATDVITSGKLRRIRASLVKGNVQGWGGAYMAFLHPDVAVDLKEETGDLGWRTPHNFSAPEAIMNGYIGRYEGFDWVETPRANVLPDAGAGGTVDVYQTLFMGKQALAKAYNAGGTLAGGINLGADPVVVPGPVTDKLRRFVPMGWYHFVGYGIFRQQAILRLETASSLGVNV